MFCHVCAPSTCLSVFLTQANHRHNICVPKYLSVYLLLSKNKHLLLPHTCATEFRTLSTDLIPLPTHGPGWRSAGVPTGTLRVCSGQEDQIRAAVNRWASWGAGRGPGHSPQSCHRETRASRPDAGSLLKAQTGPSTKQPVQTLPEHHGHKGQRNPAGLGIQRQQRQDDQTQRELGGSRAGRSPTGRV